MFEELTKTPLFCEVLARLTREIPQELTYHTVEHTRDVIKEALLLGQTEGRSQRELVLLGHAALFHDVGYLQGQHDHEERGAKVAEEMLASASGVALKEVARKEFISGPFSPAEIDQICVMIRDTQMVPEPAVPCQHASTELSKYLLDADVANFGRADFAEKLELARQELNAEKRDFERQTLALLGRHRWLTNAAAQKFGTIKSENEIWLRKQLSAEGTF